MSNAILFESPLAIEIILLKFVTFVNEFVLLVLYVPCPNSPYKLEPVSFKIENLWDYDTGEEIDFISPGVQGQKVLLNLPIKCENNWIIRRKK